MSKLNGLRIVVTRPQRQATAFMALLAAAGATPVAFPTIEITPAEDLTPLDQALQNLVSFDWLILSSVNGVNAVAERLAHLGIAALPPTLKLACVGPKTAQAAADNWRQPDFVPAEYVGEAVLPGLGPIRGQRFLLARADIARPTLPAELAALGGLVTDLVVYNTVPSQVNLDGLAALKNGVDAITFTSPSTVQNFAALIAQHGFTLCTIPGQPIYACIGPITAQALIGLGISPHIIPTEHTTEGLFQALIKYYQPEATQ